jgi:pyruvate/2-oxoglutarate dehydrogenase complex dihydrolipoamide dehydrogenase (E3) component
MSHTDRAICEDDRDGFIKVITERDGRLLGATIVNARAGEAITEFIVAMKHGLKVSDLAERYTHIQAPAYPTSTFAISPSSTRSSLAPTTGAPITTRFS